MNSIVAMFGGTVLSAGFVSAAGLLLVYTAVGREPQIASHSTLVLDIGGDLGEIQTPGVLGQFLESPPTLRTIVDALRKALLPEDIVIGGGNVRYLKRMPPHTRRGNNRDAFKGGVRLWK